MADYIKREDAIDAIYGYGKSAQDIIKRIPAADVVERDEGIKMGAELAAMHGSDATSQELSKAYFDGMEDGYKKGRSGFEKRSQWIKMNGQFRCMICGYKISPTATNYCPNCGSRMVTDDV